MALTDRPARIPFSREAVWLRRSYALALRGEAPHALTLAGVALLIGGVMWALRSRPQPIAAH